MASGMASGMFSGTESSTTRQEASMTEKVRENRLRRMAERQGLALRKSRRRDPLATDYGLYWVVDEKRMQTAAEITDTPLDRMDFEDFTEAIFTDLDDLEGFLRRVEEESEQGELDDGLSHAERAAEYLRMAELEFADCEDVPEVIRVHVEGRLKDARARVEEILPSEKDEAS